jgi:hypothetical protein
MKPVEVHQTASPSSPHSGTDDNDNAHDDDNDAQHHVRPRLHGGVSAGSTAMTLVTKRPHQASGTSSYAVSTATSAALELDQMPSLSPGVLGQSCLDDDDDGRGVGADDRRASIKSASVYLDNILHEREAKQREQDEDTTSPVEPPFHDAASALSSPDSPLVAALDLSALVSEMNLDECDSGEAAADFIRTVHRDQIRESGLSSEDTSAAGRQAP